jgi:alkaline phosphatase D
MGSLRKPGLGPIVGDTTDTTCRIWIRASDPGDNGAILDANRRTIGVIGIVEEDSGTATIGDAWYFRLPREFDRTGAFLLGEDVDLGFWKSDIRREKEVKGKRAPRVAKAKPLKPDTPYRVRLGTLTLDDPWPDDAHVPDWQLRDRLPNIEAIKGELLSLPEAQCEAAFRTFPAGTNSKLSFLVGSCRYPGLLWKTKEADRIFGPMQRHFQSKNPWGDAARFTLMVGDQIYADTLNRAIPILRADHYREFQQRYLTAFGGPNLRKLLRTSTSYMILDDHEIEDNWTQDRVRKESKHFLYNIAITAYMNYQWSHGPRTWGEMLYYKFVCGGYPFFVLDTRTQRFKDEREGLRDNHMLGRPNIDPKHPGQLWRLRDWLSEQQKKNGNVPKFVVTSSVFVPNPMDERAHPAPPIDERLPGEPAISSDEDLIFDANRVRREASDSWPAYPNTRLEILKCIVQNKIQNVVFLAGDIHCSNVAEIYFKGSKDGKDLKAFSVTSSAFYWPLWVGDGDPNSYVHDSTAEGQEDPFPVLKTDAVMHYKAYGFTPKDNFTRIDLKKSDHTMTVSVFDDDGDPLPVATKRGTPPNANVLVLAPW